MDFGQAFIYAVNTTGWIAPKWFCNYNLLGAGTLRAQPYIQFGSDIIENEDITYIRLVSSNNPVLIREVTVSGNGNLYVYSSNTPFGTHPEIVIRPQTVFSPTGANEVHIEAY